MAKRRLEYRSDLSNKFWEIDVEGSTHTVCYGRIGSEGQTKSKDHGSPTRAHEAAEKLIAAKMKKGYVATPIGSKPVSKSTPKSADRSRAKRVCTVDAVYPEGAFVSLWREEEDLWIIGCDYAEKPDDVTMLDMLEGEGFVQRWGFDSTEDAEAAAAAIEGQKTKRVESPDWVEFDPAQLTPLMNAQDVPSIARYAVGTSGPLTLTRNTPFDWVLPRPASRCWCGRALMPTYQLSGAIDLRLGKEIHVYVSFCPGSVQRPYCDGSMEVLIQHGGAKSDDTVYWIEEGNRESYLVLSRSLLWSPVGRSFSYIVTTHFGEKGSPGTVRTHRFADEKAANDYFEAQTPHASCTASSFGSWYAELLAERAHFHRVVGAEPLTLKLEPIVAPATVDGNPYARSSVLFDDQDSVGGLPNYTQSAWSDAFPCPSCKKSMLFIFQTGAGAPWWSEKLNDGDAGSFQFFACPHCKGPHGGALFECH